MNWLEKARNDRGQTTTQAVQFLRERGIPKLDRAAYWRMERRLTLGRAATTPKRAAVIEAAYGYAVTRDQLLFPDKHPSPEAKEVA